MSAFTNDPWYQREIVTDELDECCDLIAAGLGIPRGNVGTKGNEAHDSGSHRSQEWILKSPFCDNRTYTVQSGLTADQLRHIAGVDPIPGEWGTTDNRRKTAAITARVIAEMKAGRLDIVREVYGAAPDLKSVTGWNNIENRPASSDSSHLDHPHLGLDRKRLRDRTALLHLAAVVIGEDMAESYSPFTKPPAAGDRPTILFSAEMWRLLRDGAQGVYDTTLPARGGLLKRLDRIEDALARLEAKPTGDVDEAALAVALAPLIDAGASPAEVAAAVRAELDKTRLGGS